MLNFIFKFLKEYSKFPITLYVYPSFHQIPSHSIETTFQHFYHTNRHNSDELLHEKVVEKIPFSLSHEEESQQLIRETSSSRTNWSVILYHFIRNTVKPITTTRPPKGGRRKKRGVKKEKKKKKTRVRHGDNHRERV